MRCWNQIAFLIGITGIFGFCVQCSPQQNSANITVSIAPKGGLVAPGTLIRLSSKKAARILYTLDETKPTLTRGLLYTKPFPLWASATIRFVAVDQEKRSSIVGSAVFQVDSLLPQTFVFPPEGNYDKPIKVSFSTDPDAFVLYSTNGKRPTPKEGLRYTRPFLIAKDTTLLFVGVDRSGNSEPVQKVHYNFPPVLSVKPKGSILFSDSVSVKVTSNKPASIDVRVMDEHPNSSFKRYQKTIHLVKDSRLVFYATDKKGASVTETHDYVFVRPVVHQNLAGKREVRASVAIDIESFDRPSWIVATTQGLERFVWRGGKWEKPHQLVSFSFEPKWMRSWDLNGDGLNDFLVGDASGRLHLFRSLSAERVVADDKLLAPWSPTTRQIKRVIPMDFDKDGQLDVVLLSTQAGKSQLLRRTSSGYVLHPKPIALIEQGAVEALAGDFDRDGKADLLVLSDKKKSPYLLFGNGKGAFRRWSFGSVLGEKHKGVVWRHAARTDFDNDGDLDLVLIGDGTIPKHEQGTKPASGTQGSHIVLLRHIVGQEWRLEHVLYLEQKAWRGVVLGDFDADGYADLFLSSEKSNQSVWIKNFLGRRLLLQSSPKANTWLSVGASVCADFSRSGRLELAASLPSQVLRLYSQSAQNKLFIRPILQGIRGNRNGIGSRLFWRANGFFVRMREIGIRSTGRDQSALFFPVYFGDKKQIGLMQVHWSDGQVLEKQEPSTNNSLFLSPH